MTEKCGCIYKNDKPDLFCFRHVALQSEFRFCFRKQSTVYTVGFWRKSYTSHLVLCIVNGVLYNKTHRMAELLSHYADRTKSGKIRFRDPKLKSSVIAKWLGLLLYNDEQALRHKTMTGF